MKLKLKATNKQMLSLIDFLQKFDVSKKEVDQLMLINLNEFSYSVTKHYVLKEFNVHKKKTFNIDVNHYAYLYNFIQTYSDEIEPFYLALMITLHDQATPQINNYKSLIFNSKIYEQSYQS